MSHGVTVVLVGQLSTESNSHNPVPTTLEDFTVVAARDVVTTFAHTDGSTLSGFLRHLAAEPGVDVRSTIAAHARPGGPVNPRVYRTLADTIVRDAETLRPDVVLLDLHGAMLTADDDDPDGSLLARLRASLGEDAVIGAGLDLHANVTTTMFDSADLIVGCKTNPHADFADIGRRVARLALEVHRAHLRPVTRYVRVPLVLTGNNETRHGPLAHAHALARRAGRHAGVLDVSIFNTHPMVDAHEAGQVVSAITDGAVPQIGDALVAIATHLWWHRDEFVHDFPPAAQALDHVVRHRAEGPWVLSDYGDRVLSGAPGDSTEVLDLLLTGRYPLRAVVPVTDAAAAAAAHRAGIGGTLTVAVGGTLTPGFTPTTVAGTVVGLSDGRFTLAGPLFAGQASSMGATAVLDLGDVTLLVTARPALTCDTAAFTSQGIRLGDHDLIVVKSGNHFQLSFRGVARPLKALTRGVGAYAPGAFAFHRRGSVHPERPVAFAPQPTTAATRRAGSTARSPAPAACVSDDGPE
jgi:microcystin degradation protein MlrC